MKTGFQEETPQIHCGMFKVILMIALVFIAGYLDKLAWNLGDECIL